MNTYNLTNKDIIKLILDNLNSLDLDTLVIITELLVIKLPYECITNDLGKEYHVNDIIGSGNQGSVYNMCKKYDCSFALKTDISYTGKPSFEGKYSKVAGELNIGPKVYKYEFCQDKNEKGELKHVNWILMEKIRGKTLSKMYPYNPKFITQVLDKYYKLMKNGIYQRDLKGDNIMIDNEKVYIIDYGISTDRTSGKDQRHIRQIIKLLIESLTTQYTMYTGCNYSFWKADNLKSRNKVFRDIYQAATDWYFKNFNEHANLWISHSRDDFRKYNSKTGSYEEDHIMEKWVNNRW